MKNIKKFFKKLASRKSFWIVIEAFILALGSIFLIYLLQPKFIPEPIRTGIKKTIDEAILGEKDTTKTSEEQAVSDQEKSSTTKPKETIDTSNWKTYSNQEYGFSVKYPEGWVIFKEENDSILFVKSDDIQKLKEDEKKYIDTNIPYTFGRVISVNFLDNENNLSFEDYAKQNLLQGGNGYFQKRTTQKGVKGLYVFDSGPNRFGGGFGEYFLFKTKDGKLCAVWLDHKPLAETPDKELSEIFNNIVKSIEI